MANKIASSLGSLKLVWDFTESNFFTFVFPNTAFGLFVALTKATSYDLSSLFLTAPSRIALTILFNWTNVYIFDLANQKLPESVLEDKANKPWRPVPSGKITGEQTRYLTIFSIPLVLLFNWYIGVWRETALLLILTWIYNDLKGGDEVFRDLIISVAFGIYNKGSVQLAAGIEHEDFSAQDYVWIGIISAVILTTMSVQDLKDQKGDALRGRKTLPLWLGEDVSRRTIATAVPIWSVLCGVFWNVGAASVLPTALGLYVAWRVVQRRDPRQDSKTWKFWCFWTATLYSLPVFKSLLS